MQWEFTGVIESGWSCPDFGHFYLNSGRPAVISRSRANPGATLLSVEINPQFCALLGRIPDARLIVHCGSARELRETLSRYGLSAPEVIVSGIPFSTMDRIAGARILEAISSLLAPGGRFVAYQVSARVADLSRPFLGPPRVEMELLNVPPMRLYRWEKHAA